MGYTLKQRIVMFIDSENMPMSHIRPLPEIISQFGTIKHSLAFGEWGTPQTTHHENQAEQMGIELVDTRSEDDSIQCSALNMISFLMRNMSEMDSIGGFNLIQRISNERFCYIQDESPYI